MKTKIFSVSITVVSLLVAPANADDARLKEMLRTLTLRLRSAETERNTLLSDKVQLEQEKKTLSANEVGGPPLRIDIVQFDFNAKF
jgi:hypothetical protein